MSHRHNTARKDSSTKNVPAPVDKQAKSGYKKIHIPALPSIDVQSGPDIGHIRDALQQYCQREIGDISNIFSDGKYKDPVPVVIVATDFQHDTTGVLKQLAIARLKREEAEYDTYLKSKAKLFGIIASMTTRNLDDRILAHQESLNESEIRTMVTGIIPTAIIEATIGTASTTAVPTSIISTVQCPLFLWKCIIHVTTTTEVGNLRTDQNNITIRYTNVKQKIGESISDYKRRVVNILDSFAALRMERPPEINIASRFLFGLEDDRYDGLRAFLSNEAAHGRDLYPVTLDRAATQATKWTPQRIQQRESNYLPTFAAIKTQKKGKEAFMKTQTNSGSTTDTKDQCTFCSRTGHTAEKCFKFLAAQKLATDSVKTSKPTRIREKHIKPAMMVTFNDGTSTEEPPAYMHGYFAFTCNPPTHSLGPHDLVLDTGASGSIVNDKSLLSNISYTKRPVTFGGISGSITTDQLGQICDLCPAYFHPKSPANIISFSQLAKEGHEISFNGHDIFSVKTNSHTYKFTRHSNGLYVHPGSNDNSILISTVSDNESQYTKREVARAKEARSLQQRLANPPDNKLSMAIAHGNIIIDTVLPADIIRAQTIYGHNSNALQGKTTIERPHPLPELSIPRITDLQSMYADIFTANNMQFLITITKPLDHLLCTMIESRETSTLRNAFRKHIGFYGQRRISISVLYSDNEQGISALSSDLSAMGITLINCGPGTHVHIVERAIRYVKEGVRSVLHGLPYSCPRTLFKMLIPYVTLRLNLFPSSTRTDKLSAFQLVYNRAAVATKDCHLEFGALYHVTTRTTNNTMASRTTLAIGVGQVPNGTGTCTFFSLSTNAFFSANHFKVIPITAEVLLHLNTLASRDKLKVTASAPFYLDGIPIADLPTSSGDPPDIPLDNTQLAAPSINENEHERTNEHVHEHVQEENIHTEEHIQADTNENEHERTDEHVQEENVHTEEHVQAHSDEHEHIHEQTSETPEDRADMTLQEDTSTPQEQPLQREPMKRTTRTARVTTPYIHPQRERRPPNKLNLLSIYHMTAKRALRETPDTAKPAIESELRTLVSKGVFRPVFQHKLTPFQRANIIRSQLNVTQKYLPSSVGDGRVKDKVKARLVGGGDGQDRNHYSRAETSSPTISTSSIFILAQVAAAEKHTVATIDIGSAYLNASMPKIDSKKLVFMRISKEVTAILNEIKPDFAQYTNMDGTLVVELDKALYGCIESALLWYQEISTFLTSLGFVQNPYDICVLNRDCLLGRTTVGIYVDDLIITSPIPILVSSTIKSIEDKYIQLKIHEGTKHNYLGMVLDFSDPGYVHINQTGMIQEIVKSASIAALELATGPVEAKPKTPTHEKLFQSTPNSPPLSSELAKEVHSLTARILFIANRGRPDLITFISFMTKRVLSPTVEDGKKLLRAIYYLRHTTQLDLKLGFKGDPQVSLYIDASFAVHDDCKSHSGTLATLGHGAYYTKSTTQKLNTTSSCEAELVALSKGLQQGLWSQAFLTAQGFPPTPILVYQDNQSTIKLIERGRPGAEQSRHINIGFFWLSNLLTRGLIKIIYCPTKTMAADLLTKPVQGSLFTSLRDMLQGHAALQPPP